MFTRFLEFRMYSHRCISAGSVAAYSACDLFRLAASPYLSPCISLLGFFNGGLSYKQWGALHVAEQSALEWYCT